MSAPNEIKPQQLLRRIGLPDAPKIVDVQIDQDFHDDPFLIPSSVRIPHTDIEAIERYVDGHSAVITCQKGLKLSQGVVSLLRSKGFPAEYLAGGMFAWRDTKDAPRVPFDALNRQANNAGLWVTRHRPKIDRIACPWLVKRFINQNAQFMFVAPSQVLNVAEKFDAQPFDVEGVFWTHESERCTFDKMLDTFCLRTPALDRLAQLVRAADTDQLASSPEAAGLLAISVGLSRQYKDDHQQLAAGMAIYDALYRWARDGQNETHAWPHGSAQ